MDIKYVINNKLFEKYLDVKVINSGTLFQTYDWPQLLDDRCPVCACKLSYPRKGNIARCKSKKHGGSFVIGIEKLNLLKTYLQQ